MGKPVDDDIFDMGEFEKFLSEKIKVGGQTGQVGPDKDVNVDREESTITLTSSIPFSKRYIKFLTKKFLKKNGLRDYVRVIADAKASYELRYFNIQEEADDE